MSRFVASLVGALVVGIVASLLESIAVRLAGALLGGSLAQTIWPVVMTGGSVTPWWVPFLGAAIGLLMFPGLYRAMLRVVIPLLGGLLVAQGLGHPGDPQIVFGLAGGSFLVDTLLRFRVKT